MKVTPKEKVSAILKLADEGSSNREIQAKTGVHYATVSRIRKVHRPGQQISKGGRPKAVPKRLERAIIRSVVSTESGTAVEAHRAVQDKAEKPFSVETARNILRQGGLKARVKRKKPLLTERHAKARLQFAQKYGSWTVEDWKRVVWSDETKICRFGSDGRLWGWENPGSEGIDPRTVQGTIKHGGGNIMLWGCMLWDGVGHMCRIDGGMDQHLYKDILEDYLHSSAEYYGHSIANMVFQHDNDPKHKSKLVTEWLRSKEIEVLDWPAQSPDLNPIEHLWSHLKRRLNAYETSPTSMQELWERTETEWNKIDPNVCQSLIESMPRRLEAVRRAKGRYTKY